MEPDESTPFLPQSPKSRPEQGSACLKVFRRVAPYALGIVFILGVGTTAYYIDVKVRREGTGGMEKKVVFEWRSQIFGWLSAILYRES